MNQELFEQLTILNQQERELKQQLEQTQQHQKEILEQLYVEVQPASIATNNIQSVEETKLPDAPTPSPVVKTFKKLTPSDASEIKTIYSYFDTTKQQRDLNDVLSKVYGASKTSVSEAGRGITFPNSQEVSKNFNLLLSDLNKLDREYVRETWEKYKTLNLKKRNYLKRILQVKFQLTDKSISQICK